MITAADYVNLKANPGTHFWTSNSSHCLTLKADGYFHMFGPKNSHHQLYASVTDLDRLNAHWSVFTA